MIHPAPSEATAPFWEAARAQRLDLPRCPACRRWLHPQAGGCSCGASDDLQWESASGHATLASFTVVRRAPHPALRDDMPYTVLLVVLDEGPQLVSGLPGDDHHLQVGQRLEVTFDDVDEELTLPRFAPTDGQNRGEDS